MIFTSTCSSNLNKRFTFFHVWSPTQETATGFRRLATRLNRCSTTKASGSYGGILIQKMGIFCSTSFTKVFDLHNLGKQRYIHCRFSCFSEIVSLENFCILNNSDREISIRNRITSVTLRDVPDGKHLCANTFEETSAAPSAFRPSVFALSLNLPSIVAPLA